MDLRFLGLETPFLHALHHLLDPSTEAPDNRSTDANKRSNVRDAEAMAATPADVIERPDSFVFEIDVPGLKSGDIKVQVEDDNVLVIGGDRKAEDEKEGFQYVRKERRIGKLMRKFVLPENAITDKITAVCQDGVLRVTVQKLAPPKPKKPRTIQIDIA